MGTGRAVFYLCFVRCCLNYIIRRDGRTLLYAHDTGIYPEATWKALAGIPFDLISLDCTAVTRDWRSGHLGFPGVRLVCGRLREIGCITDDTKIVLNHLAHTDAMTHEDIVRIAEPMGMTVAYDTLRVSCGQESTD